jgi:hypothetical protein
MVPDCKLPRPPASNTALLVAVHHIRSSGMQPRSQPSTEFMLALQSSADDAGERLGSRTLVPSKCPPSMHHDSTRSQQEFPLGIKDNDCYLGRPNDIYTSGINLEVAAADADPTHFGSKNSSKFAIRTTNDENGDCFWSYKHSGRLGRTMMMLSVSLSTTGDLPLMSPAPLTSTKTQSRVS